MNSCQKLAILKYFMTFSCIAMVITSSSGFAMFMLSDTESQQQLIIQGMFMNLFLSIFTAVATLVLAITDASKDDTQGKNSEETKTK